jgi:hypothetical protein
LQREKARKLQNTVFNVKLLGWRLLSPDRMPTAGPDLQVFSMREKIVFIRHVDTFCGWINFLYKNLFITILFSDQLQNSPFQSSHITKFTS